MDGVKIWILEIPEFDGAEVVEVDRVCHWFGGGFGRRNFLSGGGEDAVTFAEGDFERERFARRFEMLKEAIDVERGMCAENVFGLGEDIFDEGAGNDAEGNFTVDAAECEVIDLMAEGRDIGALGGVDVDG